MHGLGARVAFLALLRFMLPTRRMTISTGTSRSPGYVSSHPRAPLPSPFPSHHPFRANTPAPSRVRSSHPRHCHVLKSWSPSCICAVAYIFLTQSIQHD
eukprot:341866-Rhodomonas_salina.1